MQVEKTKDRILDVAWDLFYKKGYENTTVDEIITKCGISKGGFYHYFDTKDDLLNTLAYMCDREYEKIQERTDPTLDSFSKLIYFTEQIFRYLEIKIPLNILKIVYSKQIVQRGEKYLLDEHRVYFKVIDKIIEEGQEKGEIVTDRSMRELVNFYSMQERSVIYDWCLRDGNYPLSTYGVEMVRFFLQGIRVNK